MAENKYMEIDDNVGLKGTLEVSGASTLQGLVTVSSLKVTIDPSGTVGDVWTSAPPSFSTYQKYITMMAGSTLYRIPVFDNA